MVERVWAPSEFFFCSLKRNPILPNASNFVTAVGREGPHIGVGNRVFFKKKIIYYLFFFNILQLLGFFKTYLTLSVTC